MTWIVNLFLSTVPLPCTVLSLPVNSLASCFCFLSLYPCFSAGANEMIDSTDAVRSRSSLPSGLRLANRPPSKTSRSMLDQRASRLLDVTRNITFCVKINLLFDTWLLGVGVSMGVWFKTKTSGKSLSPADVKRTKDPSAAPSSNVSNKSNDWKVFAAKPALRYPDVAQLQFPSVHTTHNEMTKLVVNLQHVAPLYWVMFVFWTKFRLLFAFFC